MKVEVGQVYKYHIDYLLITKEWAYETPPQLADDIVFTTKHFTKNTCNTINLTYDWFLEREENLQLVDKHLIKILYGDEDEL